MIGRAQDAFTIDLTQDQQALVNERDWRELRKFKWRARWNEKTKSFYAQRNTVIHGRRTTEQMHRRILGLSPGGGRQVDHRNHDTLDNRRQNIRIATQRENHENRRDQSSHGVGVAKYDRLRRPFRAQAQIGGRTVHIGCYATAKEARNARAEFVRNSTEAHI